jgi:hypothetical protein
VGAPLRLPARPAWKPRPTRHATGAPDATCEQLHRHPCHCHASSTAEPVPRLEATLCTTQQRQPGATVNATKNGPAVMAVASGQEQRSRRQPGLRPIRGQRENPLSRREDDAPCPVPQTARARATAAPRTARPVALTPRRERRRLWQGKRATLCLRHNDRVKKRYATSFDFESFSFFPLSLSYSRDRERGIPRKGSFSVKEPGSEPPTDQRFEGCPLGRVQQPSQSAWAPHPLLVRGSKAGPSEGFNDCLRLLGLRAHY